MLQFQLKRIKYLIQKSGENKKKNKVKLDVNELMRTPLYFLWKLLKENLQGKCDSSDIRRIYSVRLARNF